MNKNKQTMDWRIVALGIFCLTVIEIVALFNGINGTMMSIIIAIIACAIGVSIDNPLKKQ